MSASPRLQPRLLATPALGAREAEAHRVEAEVLARFRIVSARAHKAMTPHSRQEWERELAGERGMRIASVAYALQGLDPEDRAYVLAPLLTAEEPPTQHVMRELAEASAAHGEFMAAVQGVLADGRVTPREIQAIAAAHHRARQESDDVVRAMRSGR